MLADMEPLDTLVLDTVAREYLQVPNDKQKEALFDKDLLIKDLKLSENDGETRTKPRAWFVQAGNITGAC
jgi:hypothetical protein